MNQYRKTPRANFLNYDEGDYFITICTKDRLHYFGEICDGSMHYSEIGLFCLNQLENANLYNDKIEMVVHVVMPNHIHAIVRVKSGSNGLTGSGENIQRRSPNPALRACPTCQRHVPALSRYISSFKGAVTKYARSNNSEFGWQGRYHDHFIRGAQDGNNIYEYIINNVSRWEEDCFRQQ